MKKIAAVFILLMLAPRFSACAKDFTDYKVFFDGYQKEHILVAFKKEKTIYAVDAGLNTVVSYRISTGINPENKSYEGDNATPEGVYVITEIYEAAKPETLVRAEEEVQRCGEDCGEAQRKAAKLKKQYESGRKRLAAMNAVFFRAKDGYKKWGTNEDLGRNAYGPVFMRLSYPEKEDYKRHAAAKKKGYLPMKNDGSYPGPGSGIAIHGTNDPASLGHDASSGCIRLSNEEIIELRRYASPGVKVIIK